MASIIVGSYQLTCNCPDFTNKVEKNLSSRFQSELVDRDWGNSSATHELLCKHLWSSIIVSGLLSRFPIPKDLPTVGVERRKVREDYFRLQRDPYLGDDFSFTDPKGATSPWIVGNR